ncbi:MAG: enoyl-CoA hydratase/isomerase family protein [Flavobacteriaceae bacterium]|nr:enoyl-CoA hydratase/isomerase family protein [Bacteroidia bacterium]NNL15836.1 enoyl-CoA hydratase/isomerase family protein [Flavobacteriaceae bacterium]
MSSSGLHGNISSIINDHIATIEFGHPAGNSFPSDLLKKLTIKLNELSDNNEVHVIVLKSEGERAFCAGASFDELLAISNLSEGKDFFSGFANVINAMRSCSKLIIGRIQGKAVGGGVGLASACDYVLASVDASIKLSEFTVGIGPFVIAPAVERKMGKAVLSELALAASEWKNAYWAKEKGLYAKVFDSIKELDREVDVLANKLASYNPEALTQMKKVLWEDTEHWESLLKERAEISGQLALSEFTKNALKKIK